MATSGWSWCWQLVAGAAMGGAISSLGDCALAQITPDGTLPNNSIVTPSGNTSVIEGGHIAGSNLFHSFEQFSVPTGGTAHFNNALNIQNIISRVTGASISNIDGLIRANGTANLFLLNPNGIIFGPNARLDIGGSFVGSTASSLKFADGTQFSATAPQTKPLLTVSVPLGLQFGGNAGSIRNQSQATNSSGESVGLQVQPGKTLALVGGDVSLDGGNLFAPGGQVELGGLAGAGTVGLNVDGNNLGLSFPNVVERADVSLTNEAQMNVSAGGGGSIAVNARNLNILGGSKLLGGIGTDLGSVGSQAGDITLNATGAMTIGQSDWIFSSRIENNVNFNATGNGGDINIQAGSLFMTNNARLSTSNIGQGDAGSISVQVKDAVSLIDSYIDSSSTGFVPEVGDSGDIQLKAGSLSMDRARLSASATRSRSLGDGGYGQGDAGSITVQVEDTVSLKDSSIDSIIGSSIAGNGGDIQLKAGSLFMTDEAILSSRTNGQGNAGNISVQVEGAVSLTTSYINSLVNFYGENYRAVGDGGDIQIEAGSLSMPADAHISASTSGQGNAGSISVQVKDAVSLSSYSYITSGVYSTAVGDGGDIQIEAGSLLITNYTRLSTSTSGQGDAGNISVQVKDAVSLTNSSIDSIVGFVRAVGDGGDIQIKARSLFMTDRGQLSASTSGEGNAGNIQINASDSVSISGVRPDTLLSSSGLFTTTEETAVGQSGNISVTTGALRVSDRALLSARTNNAFRGGNITVDANTLEVTSGGQLLTTAFSSGEAGDITVNSTDSITISGSDPTPTFAGPFAGFDNRRVVSDDGSASGLFAQTQDAGAAGNLTITTGQLTVQDGAQVSASTAGTGPGGTLKVSAPESVRLIGTSADGSPSSLLTETTGAGAGGELTITTGQLLVRDGARVSAETAGFGPGGTLEVSASQGLVELIGSGSRLTTETTGALEAGNLTITTRQLQVLDGAEVSASTSGTGRGGTLEVTVPAGSVELIGSGSGLFAQSAATGSAGNLTITTGQLQVRDGAQVTVSGESGQAGNLTATADSILLDQGKLTAVTGAGSGGNIGLQMQDLLLMSDNSLISAEALRTANGGNININTNFIVAIPSENSDISANAQEAFGGQVIIDAQGIFGTEFRERGNPATSDITATSELGSQFSGTVEINTPDVDPAQGLVNLPTVPIETEVVQACTPGGSAQQSEFIITGRGGLPPNPTDFLNTDAVWIDLDSTTQQAENRSSPEEATQPTNSTPGQLVEATGWVLNDKGEVVLIASAPTATPHSPGLTPANCHIP